MKQKLSFFSSSSTLLSLFLHLLLLQTTINATNIIDKTCRCCSVNYDFCVTSLQAVPQSHFADLQGLAIISMNLAIANASDTTVSINKLLKVSDNHSKVALEDCLELYADAIPTLEDSVRALECKDHASVNIWLSAAMEATTTCEQGFEDIGETSPLMKENYNMFQLCKMALDISTLLSSQSFMYSM